MINIAIDGPGGAGKSTIARAAAERLGYIYADTGALYRSIGLAVINKGLDIRNAEHVKSVLPEITLELKFIDGAQHVFLCGEDVSEKIRTPEISMAASAVSAVGEVRDYLFQLQRDIAAGNNCIMDGRDIGTVVLPNADVKIFLTASPEVRAQRRYRELIEKGSDVKYDDVLADMIKRDYDDSHRAIAPLKAADDAVMLDTSDRTLEESVAAVVDLARKAEGGALS